VRVIESSSAAGISHTSYDYADDETDNETDDEMPALGPPANLPIGPVNTDAPTNTPSAQVINTNTPTTHAPLTTGAITNAPPSVCD